MSDLAIPAAIGVVIPARNEQQLAGSCLRSVLRALDRAGLPSVVVMVAHRCTDATARVCRRVLGGRGLVIEDEESHDVASARRSGVRKVLQQFDHVDPRRLWLLSTDADTTVPVDWVHRLLRHSADGTAAVAGLADLASWHQLSVRGQREYRALVAAGLHGDTHLHAYAANLAVRADAYLDVGGWPSVSQGEEHALLAVLERGGWGVRRPTDVVVKTSARLNARATGGLGDLLAACEGWLDQPQDGVDQGGHQRGQRKGQYPRRGDVACDAPAHG